MTEDQKSILEKVTNPATCVWTMETIEAVAAVVRERSELLEACEAVLLFHSSGAWDDAKALRWFNIIQSPESTSKKLCSHIREVIARATGEQPNLPGVGEGQGAYQ